MGEDKQETRYKVNGDNFVTRQMGSEMVMVPLTDKVADMTSVLTLNEVGADILKILESPKTFDDLVQELMQIYDVETEQLIEDVRDFIAQAINKLVIEIINS
jgi:hypothetical protein